MATRHLFRAVTRPRWKEAGSAVLPIRSPQPGRPSSAPAPQWPHCSGPGAQLRPGRPRLAPRHPAWSGAAAGAWPWWGGRQPPTQGTHSPPKGRERRGLRPGGQSQVGVSPFPGMSSGEYRVRSGSCFLWGLFEGVEGGTQQNGEYRSGAFLFHP